MRHQQQSIRKNIASLVLRTAALLVVATSIAAPASAVDVDAVVTVDNAYGFGFGDASGMTTFFGGLRNTLAADIFNGAPVAYTAGDANVGNGFLNTGVGPELYSLTGLAASDYMYIVAWSDNEVWQGAIGEFTIGSTTVGTGSTDGWQVYATGENRDSDVASDTLTVADMGLINSHILTANGNAGAPATTSIGWVDDNGLLPDGITPGVGALAIGEDNSSATGFPIVSGLGSSAEWMWYNEDPATNPDPFMTNVPGTFNREFLIFRIPVRSVPEPTSGLALLLGLPLLGRLRRRR